jgi:ArsR family transcriptional regulator
MHNHELNTKLKEEINNIDLLKLTEIFKVLGDNTKLKILLALCDSKKCVHDLIDIVESSQSNISHALSKMKKYNILKEEKTGKHVFYDYYDDHIKELVSIAIHHIKECYNEERTDIK